ncbi:Zinc finger protein ZIC 4 [Smittium culicis]|uniref:Zinc finger protein ZIC 4 n=1 Tax=Smittium culicis TaxID=133412 RepID=A0A1R1XRW4_9FUNG|nr:Zinc finger protein ZIC 4 [Smittium culicis]
MNEIYNKKINNISYNVMGIPENNRSPIHVREPAQYRYQETIAKTPIRNRKASTASEGQKSNPLIMTLPPMISVISSYNKDENISSSLHCSPNKELKESRSYRSYNSDMFNSNPYFSNNNISAFKDTSASEIGNSESYIYENKELTIKNMSTSLNPCSLSSLLNKTDIDPISRNANINARIHTNRFGPYSSPFSRMEFSLSNDRLAAEKSSGEISRKRFPVAKNNMLPNMKSNGICYWNNCNEKFNNLTLLMDHISKVHVGRGKSFYVCNWRTCTRQNKPFTKRHKLLNHLRTHTGDKPFICSYPNCNKCFSRPDSLQTHIKTHSGLKPYTCSYDGCEKSYFHLRSLRKHERLHFLDLESKIDFTSTSNPNSDDEML